jgi:prepilin-type N-terminal cleavage/methylation domain-containing protein
MQTRFSRTGENSRALTLIEVLVVIVIIGILVALLLPAFNVAKRRAARVSCISNHKQIAAALLMYAESSGRLPGTNTVSEATNNVVATYRLLLSNELAGVTGVFRCPADTFLFVAIEGEERKISWSTFDHGGTSYGFNGSNLSSSTNSPARLDGLNGLTLESIRHPERTVLTYDGPVQWGYSWHEPDSKPNYPHEPLRPVRNVMSFVDGPAEFLKTCMPILSTNGTLSAPPTGYDYQWDPN